jgi:hypothetical protein
MAFFQALPSLIGAGLALSSKGNRGKLGLSNTNPNPANNAAGYLDQIPGVGRQYLQDYIGQGREGESMARGNYDVMHDIYHTAPDLYENPGIDFNEAPPEYASMAKNPKAFVDEIMRGYKPSEGYKYKEKKLMDEARATAAAGGFVGTQADEARRAELLNGVLGGDMQEYLNNILGIQGAGLGGEERRINRRQGGLERMLAGRERTQERKLAGRAGAYGRKGAMEEDRARRGFEAAQNLAGFLGSNLGNQAGLQFQGQRQMNQYNDTAKDNRLALLSSILGMFRPEDRGNRLAPVERR